MTGAGWTSIFGGLGANAHTRNIPLDGDPAVVLLWGRASASTSGPGEGPSGQLSVEAGGWLDDGQGIFSAGFPGEQFTGSSAVSFIQTVEIPAGHPECTIYVQWYLGLLFADAGSGSARAGAVVIPLPGGGDPPPASATMTTATACRTAPISTATKTLISRTWRRSCRRSEAPAVEVEDPARGACGPRWRAGAGSRSTAAHV